MKRGREWPILKKYVRNVQIRRNVRNNIWNTLLNGLEIAGLSTSHAT